MRAGELEAVLPALAQDLKDPGGLDLWACFIDGTFVPAKKEPLRGGNKREKVIKVMGITDRHGFPVAGCATITRPAEVTRVAQTGTSNLWRTRPSG